VLLGVAPSSDSLTSTGVLPSVPHFPKVLRLHESFMTARPIDSSVRAAPQHPPCNACQLSHMLGLASSAFARHYLRNHGCFLFLWVLRCFTSPRSLPLPYAFRQGSPDITHGYFRGFPIRRSPDQSLFTSSPGLIAGYNVLHRLLVPRHPPIALSSLLLLQRCSRPL
jgi:hypothetical protein